jgi:hypothetical protein
MMRHWSLLAAAMVVAITTSFAQQAGSGTLNGRAMDRTKSPLAGVTVPTTGAVRREVVTSLDGEYQIADLPPGRYTVTAELAGFLTETEAVDVGADERRTLDLLLRVGCVGEGLDPPLSVYFPFDQMLGQVAGVAYVRIREMGNRERLLTDASCLSVRPYIAEPLALINLAPPPGDVRIFRFYGRSWDPGLTPGDEAIVFLWREETTGAYHEMDDKYRILISKGRLNSMQMEWSPVANGDPVDDVLTKIRAALNPKPPRP